LELQRLAATQVTRFVGQCHVDHELPVVDLRVYFRNPHVQLTALMFCHRPLLQVDTTKVKFINANVQFVCAWVVDLTEAAATFDGFSNLNVET
jgi:hypothetical protein